MKINNVCVIGAGTMGGGIAALLAGVGINTFLLDIIPKELSENEKRDTSTRNRIAQAALTRALKQRPAVFFTENDANLITIGNIEDNQEFITNSDWVIEAVYEQLDVKREVFKLIENNWNKKAIVSSNTSGLPISAITSDVSDEFKKYCLITHFFNPPRYMKLLEVVPTDKTDNQILDFIIEFTQQKLGKGCVVAKDTPNFIAARIGIFSIMYTLKRMVEEGYLPEEVEKIFGPVLGRPKSAVLRTIDIIGLDIINDILTHLSQSVKDEKEKEMYKLPEFMKKMIDKKLLGEKSSAGFYKKVKVEDKTQYYIIDIDKLDYREQQEVKFSSIEKVKAEKDVRKRIKSILYGEDRATKLAWDVISETIIFSADKLTEIANDIHSIDNAMRWGFNWELGPFETLDAIGVRELAERMNKEKRKIPQVVEELLRKGYDSFYKKVDTTKYYFDVFKKDYCELKPYIKDIIFLSDIKSQKERVIKENPSCSLIDIGDGVALLEYHTTMNTIDKDIIEMTNYGLDEVAKNFIGLVIGNEGDVFSAGANLLSIFLLIQNKQWDKLTNLIKSFQNMNMRMKYFNYPVVSATHNMCLGGGCEIPMHTHLVRAYIETYIGLVEFNMGLIPAAGGCKELILRAQQLLPADISIDKYALLLKVFNQIITARVSTSAKEAKQMLYLKDKDRITMNKDKLIYDAKCDVEQLSREVFFRETPKKIKVYGNNGYEYLINEIEKLDKLTDYEKEVAKRLSKVLTCPELPEGSEVEEQKILDLELEIFLQLCSEEKTQERIRTFLQTGKRIRN